MHREFVIKICNEQTGKSQVIPLDLKAPIDVQLSIGAFGKVIMQPPGYLEGSKNHLLFIVSNERDYKAKTLHGIVKAVVSVFGGSLIWELSPSRPTGEEESDIQAYLTLNTERYSKGGKG